MINCKAPSLDYGNDGGMVEFYGDVDSSYVHHNWGENCSGAFEAGGTGQTLTDNLVAYNVSINNEVSGGFHVGGKFGCTYVNFRVEHNVFYETRTTDHTVAFWDGTATAESFAYRNNIFYLPNHQRVSNQPGFTHDHNLYYLGGKTSAGFVLGQGERIGDPLFVNPGGKKFQLQAGSPAIDAAVNLGYRQDFDGGTVPFGFAPDIGVFEYGASSSNRFIGAERKYGVQSHFIPNPWENESGVWLNPGHGYGAKAIFDVLGKRLLRLP
jgi:hypothetical protein